MRSQHEPLEERWQLIGRRADLWARRPPDGGEFLPGTIGARRRLTPREREALPLVVARLLNKEIARELAASKAHVFHCEHILKKLQAESPAELVRMRSGSTSGRRTVAKLSPQTGRTLHQEPAVDGYRARLLCMHG